MSFTVLEIFKLPIEYTSLLVSFSVALDKKGDRQNQAKIYLSQAFVAIATSSGEIRTLTGKDPNQVDKQFKKVKVNWE